VKNPIGGSFFTMEGESEVWRQTTNPRGKTEKKKWKKWPSDEHQQTAKNGTPKN